MLWQPLKREWKKGSNPLEIYNFKPLHFWSGFFVDFPFANFPDACTFIKNLPYRRNADKADIFCVLKDGFGTCSSKHAFLKYYADECCIPEVQLMLEIFKMGAQNTPKVSPV